MKAMISQPMANKTDEEILSVRNKAKEFLESKGYEVVETFFEGPEWTDAALRRKGIYSIPLYFMAKSLEAMSYCDAIYFCDGWENTRGCKLEHVAAEMYGLRIIEEHTMRGINGNY